MNIYSVDDEFVNDLREWCKNNPHTIPEDAIHSYGAIPGEKMRESTKQLLRKINLGKKLKQETKQKISQTLKGITTWNKGIPMPKEHREKLTKILSKDWIVIYPNGQEIKINNLSKFCRENNLTQPCMIRVSQGKQAHHKEFTCRLA